MTLPVKSLELMELKQDVQHIKYRNNYVKQIFKISFSLEKNYNKTFLIMSGLLFLKHNYKKTNILSPACVVVICKLFKTNITKIYIWL